MRTHSSSNLTTRLSPSVSVLAPGIIIDEVRMENSGRRTVLVIVADIGCRWEGGRRAGRAEKWYDLNAQSSPDVVALKGLHLLHSALDKRPWTNRFGIYQSKKFQFHNCEKPYSTLYRPYWPYGTLFRSRALERG
jgi:hypothetical protein